MDPRVALVVEQLWQPVPGGSGRYIVELSRELASAGVAAMGIAAHHGASEPSARDLGLGIPVVTSRLPRRALYAAWDRLALPSVDRLCRGTRVVHATTWAIPPTRRPLVVTVHDTAFLRDPGHFTSHGAAYFTRALERTKARADLVIVPSQATAEDCLGAGIPESRIRVIPHGVRHTEVTEGEVASFATTHGLTRPYVLWVGTHEPRKNLPSLLRAHRILLDRGGDLDLVLAGPSGWGDDSEEKALISALPSDRVHVVGHLGDRELACAYAGARVFCFPSVWEGFGLPVLEAMDQGVPVVTSRGTSMAEVVGSAGLLIDPVSPDQIAEALLTASGCDHDKLSADGRAFAAGYTWEASARAHAQAYGEVLG
ncbi:MAG: glycosyltransferase family 4 protein [Actinomyces sp.]|jgi:glycosyltransferase involved in cell wall biosynthesis|nr:glycosyltransferase family 1 protein [Actinomyces sp.]MCI1787968.1 glycosyltransferase family 4 protein [Actinomyces sp.]MCI1830517.1 glycosyltransferase family 4 protein [Actinomyces sp.]